MPLLDLWKANPQEFETYQVRQIVSFSGDGRLRDNNETCKEFRTFLSLQDSRKLFEYVEQCLQDNFQDSGFVLQDIVNELGRRLDYDVENGAYRGSRNKIGFDGIWRSSDHRALIVEVKTTDAYRINLDILVNYRDRLIHESKLGSRSSILLVVGRQDTGDLEAQIRGSRHAWNVRLISAEALSKIVRLKEAGDDETADMIRNLLVPREYTRLDDLINVIFLTAEDIKTPVEEDHGAESDDHAKPEVQDEPVGAKDRSYETDRRALDDVRDGILRAFGNKIGRKFIKRSKAQYWTSDHEYRVCCTISKFYKRNNQYWYAYHPKWDNFLAEAKEGYLLLGCIDLAWAFAIPRTTIFQYLDELNPTTPESGGMYWHIHLAHLGNDKFGLRLKGKGNILLVDQYKVPVSADQG